MKNSTFKRVVSLLLVVCMLIGVLAVLPMPSFAAALPTGSGNYYYKIGSNAALSAGTRVAMSSVNDEPFVKNGVVYLPTTILQSTIGAPGSNVVTVDGIQVVPLTAISSTYSGYNATVSDMGLIAISKSITDVNGAYTDVEEVALMKKFLFDNIKNDGSSQVDNFSVSDIKDTTHPYLYANQERFDELAAVWAAGEAGEAVDETLYEYIDYRVTQAENLFKSYAQYDTNGNYVDMNVTVGLTRGYQNYIFQIPYKDAHNKDGYDVGGRLGASSTHTNNIMYLAYAYQITKDIKFAKLAYQYAIYIGQWEHWGPGHYLNVADASAPYATAYDWLYQAWKQLENEGATYKYFTGMSGSDPQYETRSVKLSTIEEIIFTHSILPAYYSAVNNETPWVSLNSTTSTGGYKWTNRTNNWSAVCTAGIAIPSLAIATLDTATAGTMIDIVIDGVYNPVQSFSGKITNNAGRSFTHTALSTYQDYTVYLINKCLYILPYMGLDPYAPDGSYIESNGYWSYGTNNVYEFAAAFSTATGSHYGLLDTWGFDKTHYFALNTMSSDGLGYNYHDSNSVGALDAPWLMYLGQEQAIGDKAVAGIRKDILANIDKLHPDVWDSIFYMSSEEIGTYEYPELQYHMVGIDGYAVRDSWNAEEGSLYAAFMGESNNITHGQIDSGAFVYYNNGTRWFCDLGTENYNAYEFWHAPYRYQYYSMGPEGNNTFIITNPMTNDQLNLGDYNDAALTTSTNYYGQSLDGYGDMIKTGNNSYGAFAVIDNTSAYSMSYSYKYTQDKESCGSTTQEDKTGTGSISATSALRGIFLTNDRKTFVIQDQVTLSHEADVAWVAHTLANVEVMLSIDGTVAYMYDGKSAIRVTLIDDDNQGFKFRISDAGEHLVFSTNANNFSTQNGGDPQNDYTSYKKLLIEGSRVSSFNVAVVIEEVDIGVMTNDTEDIGYTWTDMNSWTPYADTRYVEGGDVEAGDVASVTVFTPASTAPLPDDDTPIVDILGTEGYSAQVKALADAEGTTETFTAASFTELAELINNAPDKAVVTVDLYKSNFTPLVLSHACTINTNGNSFLATSTSYIANVNGKTITYEKGTITVNWIIDGVKHTENYTGSIVASYKGAVNGGELIEVDNGDGTYSYYITGGGWSTVENGEAMSSDKLIVTSENNTFYLANTKYDGAFVGVKSDGSIVGYTNPDDFFTSTFRNTAYERVSVTNDFAYDATQKNDNHSVPKTMNLYLNGYSVTYTSDDKWDHMFSPGTSGVELNVYGPGYMTNESGSANFISGSNTGGADIYFENVTIYSTIAIIDHRYGNAIFKNCDITIEKNASALGVLNRNNTTSPIPRLTVDGCWINLLSNTATSCVFNVQNNSYFEVTGGTNISTKVPCYLFQLGVTTTGSAPSFSFPNGCTSMQAVIGDVNYAYASLFTPYINDTNEVKLNSDDDPIPDYQQTNTDGTLKYAPTASKIFYGDGYKSATDPSSLNLVSGVKAVSNDNPDFPYVLSSNYATVIWYNGTTEVGRDYWADGTTPVPSDSVKASFTVGSGQMLDFSTYAVEGGKTYSFSGYVMESIGVQINMSLQSDFNFNFFVDIKDGMSFTLDGDAVTPSTVNINGTNYYKIAKTNILPTEIGEVITLKITYGGRTITRAISPIDYIDRVLASNTDEKTQKMMINIVKYAESAFVYYDCIAENIKAYNAVLSLYNEYKSYATVSVVKRQEAELSAITDGLYSAFINIDDSLNFRFRFNPEYTGTVTFSYVNNGTTITTPVTVTNGRVGENDYFDVALKAFDMMGDITITTAGGTATYNLATYYHHTATELGALTNFLNAMYSYCETAKNYKGN